MRRKKGTVILLVCLASILSVLVLFPVYVLVICALKEPTSVFELSLLPKPGQIRLENFSEVFERIEFGRYMLNSFVVAFSVTILALLFHSMAGFAFSHMRFRGKNAIFVGIMTTAAIPFSVPGRSAPALFTEYTRSSCARRSDSTRTACHSTSPR